jgi:hypothetical protein
MFEDDPQLTAFAQDLRAAADALPAPAVHDELAAVLAGDALAPLPAWLPTRRRARRSVTLRVTIAGAAFGLGVGSLGVAGALPDPVQRQLSHAGDVVGVHLPVPAEDHAKADDSQGRDEDQQQAPGIRIVRPTTPAARHDAGDNDDQGPTSTTASNNGKHLGEDSNDNGDDHSDGSNRGRGVTTTTVDDHRGDEGNGEDNSGGARVKSITTTTTDDRGGDDATSSDDDERGDSGSSGRSLSR